MTPIDRTFPICNCHDLIWFYFLTDCKVIPSFCLKRLETTEEPYLFTQSTFSLKQEENVLLNIYSKNGNHWYVLYSRVSQSWHYRHSDWIIICCERLLPWALQFAQGHPSASCMPVAHPIYNNWKCLQILSNVHGHFTPVKNYFYIVTYLFHLITSNKHFFRPSSMFLKWDFSIDGWSASINGP